MIPRLEELSIKKMVEGVRDDPQVKAYLPDEYFDKKVPHREFFFNILNTHNPEYVQTVLAHAHE